MEQAADAARFLADTPIELLGPAGRALRDMATNWRTEPLVFTVVPEVESPEERHKSTKPRRSSDAGNGQMPLLGEINGPHR